MSPSALTGPVFGSLVVGTGLLGCWQTQRYFDKVKLISLQSEVLSSEPVNGSRPPPPLPDPRLQSVVTLTGRFDHAREVMVGPRGPPPGSLSAAGPMSGRGGGGIASSPQGYYVVAPFTTIAGDTVLVNRGWSYKSPKERVHACDWSRPASLTRIKAVTQAYESGGYFAPPPISPRGVSDDAPTLFLWMQEGMMKAETGAKGNMYKEIGEEAGRGAPVKNVWGAM